MLVDQKILKKSDRYTLSVTKDHNLGLVVQVVRMNPSHVKMDTGVVTKGHMPVALYTQVIKVGTLVQGKIEYVAAEKVQAELRDAINKAQSFFVLAQQNEDNIDSMLALLPSE